MDIKDIITITVSLTAIVTGFFSLFVGLKNGKRVKLEAIKSFYEESNSPTIVAIAKILSGEIRNNQPFVYNYETNGNIGTLIDFYDKWGALCIHHYLPFWIFKGSFGFYILSIYKHLEKHIEFRRNESGLTNNPKYAFYFEGLVEKIIKNIEKASKEQKNS